MDCSSTNWTQGDAYYSSCFMQSGHTADDLFEQGGGVDGDDNEKDEEDDDDDDDDRDNVDDDDGDDDDDDGGVTGPACSWG